MFPISDRCILHCPCVKSKPIFMGSQHWLPTARRPQLRRLPTLPTGLFMPDGQHLLCSMPTNESASSERLPQCRSRSKRSRRTEIPRVCSAQWRSGKNLTYCTRVSVLDVLSKYLCMAKSSLNFNIIFLSTY